MRLRASAPAKVNLCLYLGGTREDGRHRLLTLFQSLSLADTLTAAGPAAADEVICAGVSGENLVLTALRALRAAGWQGPPLSIEIEKRIPVAAGMAGGSADAAAALRIADAIAPLGAAVLGRVAAALGADVPSQLRPGVSLGSGAGELLEPVGALAEHAFLVLPSSARLSTADVYREADRLRLARTDDELELIGARLRGALAPAADGTGEAPIPQALMVNDLQPAAISLCEKIEPALAALLAAGADHAMVCGSGPTVVGIWWGTAAYERARAARPDLAGLWPGACVAVPAAPGAGLPQAL